MMQGRHEVVGAAIWSCLPKALNPNKRKQSLLRDAARGHERSSNELKQSSSHFELINTN